MKGAHGGADAEDPAVAEVAGQPLRLEAAIRQQATQRAEGELRVVARQADPLAGGVAVRQVVTHLAVPCAPLCWEHPLRRVAQRIADGEPEEHAGHAVVQDRRRHIQRRRLQVEDPGVATAHDALADQCLRGGRTVRAARVAAATRTLRPVVGEGRGPEREQVYDRGVQGEGAAAEVSIVETQVESGSRRGVLRHLRGGDVVQQAGGVRDVHHGIGRFDMEQFARVALHELRRGSTKRIRRVEQLQPRDHAVQRIDCTDLRRLRRESLEVLVEADMVRVVGIGHGHGIRRDVEIAELRGDVVPDRGLVGLRTAARPQRAGDVTRLAGTAAREHGTAALLERARPRVPAALLDA
jgi:hypothetical protein